jgi:hypothetical protein
MLKVLDLTAGWKPSGAMLKTFSEVITRFVSELEDVPDERKGELHEVVWAAVMAMGRQANTFTKQIAERFSIPLNTAATISMYQATMGRYVKDIARRSRTSTFESIWMYSNAPCDDAPHHEKLDGRRFNLEEGLLVKGKRIWPGSESGCRCCERAVLDHIEGFE